MLARPHPIWGDWLHVQANDMRRLFDRQLDFRDKALEADPSFSGMPPDFVQYCRLSWLPAHLSRPFYRAQAETHLQTLASRIDSLNRDIERQSGSMLDRRDAALAEREWLAHELAQVSTNEVET